MARSSRVRRCTILGRTLKKREQKVELKSKAREGAAKWLRLTTVAAISALMACASTLLAAQQTSQLYGHQVEYVKEKRKSSEFHPATVPQIYRHSVLAAIRGVLAQASIEYPENKVALALGQGECSECIRVSTLDKNVVYHIAYDDLVPMVLFVEGGGVSLYTIPSHGTSTLDYAHFQIDAGFVSSSNEIGLIALEFKGTKYEQALQFLDLCNDLCVESSPPYDWASYINHDAEQKYTFSFAATTLRINGGVFRTYWKDKGAVTDNRQVIITGEVAISPPDRLAKRLSMCTDPKLRSKRGYCADEVLEKLPAAKPHDDLSNAYYLYHTLALLRTAKRSAPGTWSEFLEHLMSEALVADNPSTWNRYTESFCSIYGNQC